MEQILAHPFLAISGDGDDAIDTDGASASHVCPRIELPSPVPLTHNASSPVTRPHPTLPPAMVPLMVMGAVCVS